MGRASQSAEDGLGLRQSPAGCAVPPLQPQSRGFCGSTDVQPGTSRLRWHRSLVFAGSAAAAAGAWTGDKETARVSDGREGQRGRKMGGDPAMECDDFPKSLRSVGLEPGACLLSHPLTCLLDCATRNKSIFSLPCGDRLRAAQGGWHLSERLWRKEPNS